MYCMVVPRALGHTPAHAPTHCATVRATECACVCARAYALGTAVIDTLPLATSSSGLMPILRSSGVASTCEAFFARMDSWYVGV